MGWTDCGDRGLGRYNYVYLGFLCGTDRQGMADGMGERMKPVRITPFEIFQLLMFGFLLGGVFGYMTRFLFGESKKK